MGVMFPGFVALGLAAAGLVVALHMMRRRAREAVIPSLMLWQNALAQAPPQPWRRLRSNLLMLLQILAVVLVALALARPYLRGVLVDSVIVVLDASVSMGASQGDGTRFSYAQAEALGMAGRAAALIVVDDAPRIVGAGIEEAIRSVRPGYAAFDEAAVAGLVSVARELHGDVPVVMLTDRERSGIAGVDVRIVSQGVPNIAIEALTHTHDADRTVALVRLQSFSDSVSHNYVSVFADDVLIETRPFSIEAGEGLSLFFLGLPPGVERVEARLMHGDALAADDSAYSVAAIAQGASRALLVGYGNVFLERALGQLPQLELFVAPPGDIDVLSGFDLYVYDGVMPQELPEDGHIIIINPPQGNNFINTTPAQVTSIHAAASPIMRFIGDMQFAIGQANVLDEVPYWGLEVLSSPQGPLLVAGQQGGQRIAVLGFDFHNTDLPLRMEFPIFINNLVEFALPAVASAATVAAGEGMALQLPPAAEYANIVSPGGDIYQISPQEPYFVPHIPGFYLVEIGLGGGREFAAFAVNASRAASDLRPVVPYYMEAGQTPFGLADRELQGVAVVIVLVVLGLEFWLYVRRRGGISGAKMAAGMRVATVALLVAALMNPGITRAAQGVGTVFVVDISDSAAAGEALEGLQVALAAAGDSEYVGIVAFGADAFVERPVLRGAGPVQYIRTAADTSQTNIAQGLQLASSMIPEGLRRRVVLLSDGVETMGDAMAQVVQMRDTGIVSVGIPPAATPEAQLSELRLPRTMGLGSHFEMEVVAHSTTEQEATLRIFRNNALVHSRDVLLGAGESRFAVADVASVPGSLVYRAELLPEQDTFYQNNTLFAHSHVEGPARVLVVEGMTEPPPGAHVAAILTAGGTEVSRVRSMAAPSTLEALRAYEAVVLADVSLEDTPPGFDALLEAYVRTGGGLLAIGGQNTFALGGFGGTPLERALPIEMTITDEQEEGAVAMLVVLDRSGSMMDGRFGLTYMELAVEATIRAVETLSEEDYFGVIAFDHESHWFSALRPVRGNRADMIAEVGSITPGGGTSILPALRMAYEALVSAPIDPQFRHILLLTDGIAEQYGYGPVIAGMNYAGITLSTVAFGGGADTALLVELAEMGQGRYYFVDEFTDLPRIFAAETQLAGRSFLNHEEFFPEAVGGASSGHILGGVEGVPMLGGWVSATLKPLAEPVLLEPGRGEPILATMRYGLGRSAAFLSDMAGLWSGDWIASPEGGAILVNTMAYLQANAGQTQREFALSAQPVGSGALVSLTLPMGDVVGANLTLVAEDMVQSHYELSPAAPGLFEAVVGQGAQGAYTAVLELHTLAGTTSTITTGLAIPFGPEYDIRRIPMGELLMANIASAGGGTLLPLEDIADVFYLDTPESYTYAQISYLLLSAALVLLLIDVAVRRFPPRMGARARMNRDTEVKSKVPTRGRPVPAPGVPVAVSTTAILMAAKSKRGR